MLFIYMAITITITSWIFLFDFVQIKRWHVVHWTKFLLNPLQSWFPFWVPPQACPSALTNWEHNAGMPFSSDHQSNHHQAFCWTNLFYLKRIVGSRTVTQDFWSQSHDLHHQTMKLPQSYLLMYKKKFYLHHAQVVKCWKSKKKKLITPTLYFK